MIFKVIEVFNNTFEYCTLRKIAKIDPREKQSTTHLCWSKLFLLEPIVGARWPDLAVEITTGGRRKVRWSGIR
jgi:hypothetical protein